MGFVQKRISQVSLARQTAKGSITTVGQYQVGVNGGNLVGADASDNEIPMTWANRDVEEFDRDAVTPKAGFGLVAMPKTLGALLFGACGADTVTGASDPFSHAFKTGTDLPYWTILATSGAEKHEITDAKLDSLELIWNQSGAMTVKTSWLGCSLLYPASYTAGTDERPKDGLFKGAGGVFTVDGAAAIVKSGTIKIENNLSAIFGAASVEPADIAPGEHKLTMSLVIVPTDLTLFRKVITGTVAGTGTAISPYSGALETKFLVPGQATHNLDVVINAAQFAVDFPDADPSGGAQELTLVAVAHTKSDGTIPYTITLANSVATY